MFGHGETEVEAIEDLCKALIQCYEDLTETENVPLGPSAKQLKEYLVNIIEKKNAA
jgi:hypothetical protein